jgi:hypothetical protein
MAPQVSTIQRHLERIYAIDTGCRAEQFLVTDTHLSTTGDALPPQQPEEQLLVREEGTELELGLYFSSDLLDRLHHDDPLTCLHDGNLADLCLVIEGVSHFLCVAWHAACDLPVTGLELELQAEIDKYILALLLAARQGHGRAPRGLHQRLFRHYRIAPGLDHAMRQRYHRANTYAAAYCAHLEQRHLNRSGPRALLRELRRFYRLHQRAKLGHISRRGRPH